MSRDSGKRFRLRALADTWWKITLLSVGGLFLLLFFTRLVLTVSAQAAVNREIAKIRARGEPLTGEELAPPPVSDQENAAVALEPALAEFVAAAAKFGKQYPDNSWFRIDTADPDFAEKTRMTIDLTAPLVELTREALERPKCQYNLDFALGAGMLMPHLSKLRNLARVLRIHALSHAEEGKSEKAVEDVLTILALARTLDDEPVPISKLVVVSILGIGLDSLGCLERNHSLSTPARVALKGRLQEFDFPAMMLGAMMGERVLGAATIDMIMDGGHGWDMVPPVWSPWLVRPLRFHYLRDKALYLRRMREFIACSRLPTWEAVRRFPACVPGLKICIEPAFRAPFTSEMLDTSYYHRGVRAAAHRDAAVLGLSLELCRSAHGDYPDALDALVPEFLPSFPPDPFTGEPFIYRRRADGKGFIVYSVGPDLTDDGGVHDPDAGKDDISWERKP